MNSRTKDRIWVCALGLFAVLAVKDCVGRRPVVDRDPRDCVEVLEPLGVTCW